MQTCILQVMITAATCQLQQNEKIRLKCASTAEKMQALLTQEI
jgi:hypothetical protein